MKQLYTRFSQQIDPAAVLPEYPRPMLVRGSYYNLNGLWEYAVTEEPVGDTAAGPSEYDGRILVPFSPECALSGVKWKILPKNILWYRRKLPILPAYDGVSSVLLHFGAVDQHAWVYVNGILVGEHHGGYLPFTCDITKALYSYMRFGTCTHSVADISPVTATAGPAAVKTDLSNDAMPDTASLTNTDADAPAEAETGTEDILTVKVIDLTDTSYHSRGKQKLEPSGMYYTAQSGIWQTVWMEVVPENYIERVSFRPDYDNSKIRMKLYNDTDEEVTYTIYAPCIDADACRDGSTNLPIRTDRHLHSVRTDTEDIDAEETAPAFAKAVSAYKPGEPPSQPKILLTGKAVTNHAFSVSLPGFKPWSPEEPYLYYVTFETSHDRVQSYFAMRKCDLQRGADGVPRMYLNNQPYFQTGLLDQGYYPESLYTPPTDEAMTADILSAKTLGFNMLRKHAKIESDRFYYHCDRLGMLVWQDMVNGGSTYKDWYVTYLATAMNQLHIRPGDRFRRLLSRREKAGRDEFTAEVRDTIRALGSHPSIVVWVPFNEGWGQFDTLKICSLIKKMDPDRLVDHASGWFDLGGGDIQSIHYYFFRYRFKPERRRAMALTEYGGYSWSVPGHCTHDEEYGYQKYSDSVSLTAAFQLLITDTILPSVREGLAAAIYTQLTDIESETNGLYTYDRQICKMDAEVVRECNRMMKETGAYSP